MLTQRQVAEKIWNTGKGYGHIFNDISKEECIEKIEKHIKNYSFQYYGDNEISLQEKLTEQVMICNRLNKRIEELEEGIYEHNRIIERKNERISILEQAVRECCESMKRAKVAWDKNKDVPYSCWRYLKEIKEKLEEVVK